MLPKRLCGLFALTAMVACGATAVSGGHASGARARAADDLGPVPPASSVPQSRCAAMSLSSHVVTVGETITATVVPHDTACGGAVRWSWGALKGLGQVTVCGASATTCLYKASAFTGTAGHRYVIGCLDGSSGSAGAWASCDYYAVLGKTTPTRG